MKSKIIHILVISVLMLTTYTIQAQIYRAAATEALKNDGRAWTEKRLPPSVITFSDYSGQVEIKAPISSLFAQRPDSINMQSPADTMADFTMTLDRDQIKQQITNGKTFITAGRLALNGISKKMTVQCLLTPRDNPEDGFSITVMIRFIPADFGMKITGETEDTPLIVKVTGEYMNNLQAKF